MLFALVGFYRNGSEDGLRRISDDVNEFLGPSFLPLRLAGVFRDENGRRIGNLVLIDAKNFREAEDRLKDSPALNAGLYERSEIAALDIEIGGLNSE